MSSLDLTEKRLTEHGLSPEEDLKCNKAFEAFDKDGSGYIDANELVQREFIMAAYIYLMV